MEKKPVIKLPSIVDLAGVTVNYTQKDLDFLAKEASECGVYAVSVNPCNVKTMVKKLQGTGVRVGGTVGFCLGVSVKEIKVLEAVRCLEDGAQELDMVMNLAAFLDENDAIIAEEISAVANACPSVPLKIIIEVGYLNDDQIIRASKLVKDYGGTHVKTMTGLDPSPANRAKPEQVALIRQTVGPNFGVKASGGTRTLNDILAFYRAGANRIGMRAQDIRRIKDEWNAYFGI